MPNQFRSRAWFYVPTSIDEILLREKKAVSLGEQECNFDNIHIGLRISAPFQLYSKLRHIGFYNPDTRHPESRNHNRLSQDGHVQHGQSRPRGWSCYHRACLSALQNPPSPRFLEVRARSGRGGCKAVGGHGHPDAGTLLPSKPSFGRGCDSKDRQAMEATPTPSPQSPPQSDGGRPSLDRHDLPGCKSRGLCRPLP